MIYTTSLQDITEHMLEGFFNDWENAPTPATHLHLLERSYKVVVAIDEEKNEVVGFITAISDGLLSASISFLEVLPQYRGQGIGKDLLKEMLEELDHLYMIDVVGDETVKQFCEELGFKPSIGMVKRNLAFQSGKED